MQGAVRAMGGLAVLLLAGCGDDGPAMMRTDSGSGDAGRPGTDGGQPAADGARPGEDAGDRPPGEDGGAPPVPPSGRGLCFDAPPPSAEMPAALPTYSGGSCPMLMPGMNRIRSGGADRQFILVVPEGYDGSEELPLAVLWPWLGGEAADFLERGEVQDGANRKRFLAAIMDEKGDLWDKWPWGGLNPMSRVDEELRYFDDVVACVAAQYEVNRSCVSSVGVSAGALWTAQLAPRRSGFVASFISLSGGVGGLARSWSPSPRPMPALVLWGGPSDWCGLDFQVASREMEEGLALGGHFVLECVHNCGHGVPPFAPPEGEPTFGVMWDFILNHPYWLADGQSPYLTSGMPRGSPEWCSIGAGRATMRSGACAEGGCF